jgi:HEXXH motif-containing protein
MSEAYAREVVRAIATRRGNVRESELVLGLLNDADLFSRSNIPWRAMFGFALETSERDPTLAMLHLVCEFLMNGAGNTWETTLEKPGWLFVNNELHKICGHIVLDTIDGQCRLRISADGGHREHRWCPHRLLERTIQWPRPPVLDLCVKHMKVICPEPDHELRPVQDRAQARQSVENAFDILNWRAPEYASWVRRSVSAIMACGSTGELTYSQSMARRPGLVALSFPMSPLLLSEALVHEAAHQHFFLASRFFKYCENIKTSRCFSPIKRVERPLWSVLLAYHAVGNIVLYYAALLRNNYDPGGLSLSRLLYWRHMGAEFEDELNAADVPFTAAGRDLYMRLQHSMFDCLPKGLR